MPPRNSPVPASHTSTLPSSPPAATTVSSLLHVTQLAVARLMPVSVATAAPDDALHSRTLPSDNAAATTAQLGLKCTLVMLEEAPVRQAMAVKV